MAYPCSFCMMEFDNPVDRGAHKAHYRGGRCALRFGTREPAKTANATPFRLRSMQNDSVDSISVQLSHGSVVCNQSEHLSPPSSTCSVRSRVRSSSAEEAPAAQKPRFDSAFELYRMPLISKSSTTQSDIQKLLDLVHHPKFNRQEVSARLC